MKSPKNGASAQFALVEAAKQLAPFATNCDEPPATNTMSTLSAYAARLVSPAPEYGITLIFNFSFAFSKNMLNGIQLASPVGFPTRIGLSLVRSVSIVICPFVGVVQNIVGMSPTVVYKFIELYALSPGHFPLASGLRSVAIPNKYALLLFLT